MVVYEAGDTAALEPCCNHEAFMEVEAMAGVFESATGTTSHRRKKYKKSWHYR
jgi:hypothetical protein